MPLLFLIGGFISAIISVYIWMMPTPAITSPVASKSESRSLTTYFQQKTIPIKKTVSFASLMSQPDVLGETDTATPAANNTKKLETKAPTKSTYTIAFLGDSMFDTLGPGIPHVASKLKAQYPKTNFTLINHGVGASNIESGLNRLTNGYTYLGEKRKAVLEENADIIVVESFAYNHWDDTQSDLDRHWTTIAKLVETIRQKNPQTKIILAATIAPHCPTYTDGSANLPPERKQKQCETVKKYLQNMVNFATSQKYPLIDAYHPSLKGTDGNPTYINQGDHIHPSDAGKNLFAREFMQVVQTVL